MKQTFPKGWCRIEPVGCGFDDGYLNAFLAAALLRVVREAVQVQAPDSASVVSWIQGVACIWELPHTLRTSVVQKSVACIRQNGLSGCTHWCPKRPLRASVSEMTLACIRLKVTKN